MIIFLKSTPGMSAGLTISNLKVTYIFFVMSFLTLRTAVNEASEVSALAPVILNSLDFHVMKQGGYMLLFSTSESNHMWQICNAMYSTDGEKTFLSFHPQTQLLCYGWMVMINATEWCTALQNGETYLWSPLISLDNNLVWANRLIPHGHIRLTALRRRDLLLSPVGDFTGQRLFWGQFLAPPADQWVQQRSKLIKFRILKGEDYRMKRQRS